jgi:SAM-dependent methyltransferase
MEDVYTREFYTINYIESQDSYKEIQQLIRTIYHDLTGRRLSSVLDVGCALGGLLESFGHLDRKTGIDFHRFYSDLKIEKEDYWMLDINKSDFGFTNKFDVTVCIETAEHLIPEAAERLITNLCNTSDFIFFSAATVGQGGDAHINERPHEYWHELFSQNNFRMAEKVGDLLNKSFFWYKDNLFFYRRDYSKKKTL